MISEVEDLISKSKSLILALILKPVSIVAHTAGGGAELISMLTSTPGSSAIFRSGSAPWSREAVNEILGYTPDPAKMVKEPSYLNEGFGLEKDKEGLYKSGGYTSWETAVGLASRAWDEAHADGKQSIGVGCTATLMSSVPHRGGHTAWVCIRTGLSGEDVVLARVRFDPGYLSRDAESAVLGCFILGEIMRVAGMERPWPGAIKHLTLDITVVNRVVDWPIKDLDIDQGTFLYHQFGSREPLENLDPEKHFLYPVTLNPYHEGHGKVAHWISRVTGKRPIFQISRNHPVKGRMDSVALRNALASAWGRAPVIVSEDQALYVDKAKWGLDIAMGSDAFFLMLKMGKIPNDIKLYVASRPGSGLVSSNLANVVPVLTPGWDVSSSQRRK